MFIIDDWDGWTPEPRCFIEDEPDYPLGLYDAEGNFLVIKERKQPIGFDLSIC